MKKQDAEARKVASIIKLIDSCDKDVTAIKAGWQDSHNLFQHGSVFKDKQSWQTQASLNRFQASIRSAQGQLMSTLLQGTDWWSLKPKSPHNAKANILRNAFEKAINYYLESGNFKRHAATFFLNSLISIGNLYVGWKYKMVQNPEYVLEKTRKERAKEQARRAKLVANPGVTDEVAPVDIVDDLVSAIEDVKTLATGEPIVEDKIPEYVQYGCLDFQNPHFQFSWWDPNTTYMEDSPWKAFGCEKSLTTIKHWAKLGYFSQDRVNKIAEAPRGIDDQYEIARLSAKRGYGSLVDNKSDMVELIYYYGPLIVDGEIKKDRWFAVIANRSTILKEGAYPYWEPPGHLTPIINSAVKEIPYMATGAGIGDSAKDLQRTYDSNFQLVCDTFRMGIAGVNVVDRQALIDKSALDEGIEPGKVLEVRGDPKKAFARIELTSNLENQVSPVQEVIRQGIDMGTGLNDIAMGAPNARSRTTAAETNARIQGAQRTVNTVAMDLEQSFLIPLLQKVFARFLQFGLPEIESNFELQSLMTDEELQELSSLNESDRMMILNHFYSFQVRGFTERENDNETLMRLNEFMQVVFSNPAAMQMTNIAEVLRIWSKLSKLDKEGDIVVSGTPFELMQAETQVLLSGHMVVPSEQDDHEMHLQNQGALMNTPNATPELQQHIMMHQQALMQIQAMQQQQQQGSGGNEPVQ